MSSCASGLQNSIDRVIRAYAVQPQTAYNGPLPRGTGAGGKEKEKENPARGPWGQQPEVSGAVLAAGREPMRRNDGWESDGSWLLNPEQYPDAARATRDD